jgi:hypothetical protein
LVLFIPALHLTLVLFVPALCLMLVRPCPALEPRSQSPANHAGQNESGDQEQQLLSHDAFLHPQPAGILDSVS